MLGWNEVGDAFYEGPSDRGILYLITVVRLTDEVATQEVGA